MTLLEALKHIKRGNRPQPDVGICSNAHRLLARADRDSDVDGYGQCENLFAAMGVDISYPVDGLKGYDLDNLRGTTWENPKRLALLDDMIAYLEQNGDVK